jgi:hypothetical protein
MSRTPAKFQQADLSRALRAALKISPRASVELRPDGTIMIRVEPAGDKLEESVEPSREIVL